MFETSHKPMMVVLTGGPGAGKTAVLELARQFFKPQIDIVPESATIVFRGGFTRKNTIMAQKAAQRAIYHIQQEHERLFIEESKKPFLLCDRGTLDGLAYWPDKDELFWEEVRGSFHEELKKYDAVIHMKTPGRENGYNQQSNGVRIESEKEAASIDEKLLSIWETHPKRFVIETNEYFSDKALEALDVIKKLLRSIT